MKQTLKGRSKQVVIAWNEFLRDPANKLPMVADAINSLDRLIHQIEADESNNKQLKLKL